jgi:uncharacterized membrane protein
VGGNSSTPRNGGHRPGRPGPDVTLWILHVHRHDPNGAPLPENVAAALCYLAMPLSAVVFLLLPPFASRSFVKFHAVQAIITVGAMIALTVATRFTLGLLFIVPYLGRIVAALILLAMSCGFIALWIWLMYQALQGKRYRLPYIGDIAASQAA